MLAYFGGSYGREVWWMLIRVIAASANIRVWSTVKYLYDCKVAFQWNIMYGCLAESSKKDKEETFSFNFCKLGIFWWKLCTISSPPSPSCELNCKPWHDIWCISWRIWEPLTLCWFIKQFFEWSYNTVQKELIHKCHTLKGSLYNTIQRELQYTYSTYKGGDLWSQEFLIRWNLPVWRTWCCSETTKVKSARDSQYGGEKREREFKSHFWLLKNSSVLADIGFS